MTRNPIVALAVPMSHNPLSQGPGTTSSRPAEQLRKEFHDRADPNIAHFSSRAQNDFHSTFGNLLSHRDSKGDTNEIGVLELDSRPFVAVVENQVIPLSFQSLRDVLGRRSNRLILDVDRRNHNLKRRNGWRQPEAVLVIALFDRRGQDSFDSDAVASHDRHNFLAIFVEPSRSHRLRIPVTQPEDVPDKNGKEVMPIMGCYGIGIERILTAAVEQSNDENGFWLPSAIAPFEIVVSPVNVKDETVKSAAEEIAQRLEAAGFDVLLDDRDERPGVKFKDADLVGIPFRVTVGKKVTEGTVEVVLRSTREVRDVTISAVVDHFQELLRRAV